MYNASKPPRFGNLLKSAVARLSWIAVSILSLAGASVAQANLVKLSYESLPHNATIEASPNTQFVSPADGISFMVSGGIDRRLRITIIEDNSNTTVFSQQSDNLLGAGDLINYNGRSYYAIEFMSPKLQDGHYLVRTDILSAAGAVVQTNTMNLTVDTQGPSLSSFFPSPFSINGNVIEGDVWKLGIASGLAANNSSFHLTGVDDPAGISSVKARVFRESGELFREHNATYSLAGKTAAIQYRSGFFPNSDLNEVFTVDFIITDRAGNQTLSHKQKVMFDNIVNSPTAPFAVYDPDNTAELAPGLTGFVPYQPGYGVKTNPIRLAWQIPKSNWHTYREGGISFDNKLGENTVAGEDDDYVYLIGSLPYRSENGNHIRFVNFGAASGGLVNYDLVLDDVAPKTPVIEDIEYYFTDIGWHTYDSRIVYPHELPIKVTGIRYTVEERGFDQVATHYSTCTIPAGQTQCEIPVNISLNKGTTGYLHNRGDLHSANGELNAQAEWAYVWWNDLHYPIISYEYDQDRMLLTLRIRQPQQGGHQNKLTHDEAWLETAEGQRINVGKRLVSSLGENFVYEFDLSTLTDGAYDLVAFASETLGPVTRLPLFNFKSDNSSPVVVINSDAGQTLDTLDDLSFTVIDDKDPNPRVTSITLSGGPTGQPVALSYRKTGDNTYGFEYPILFPSMSSSEAYTITVTAVDSHLNVGSGSYQFMYTPRMINIMDTEDGMVSTPAVPEQIFRKNGSKLINSEQLTLADGTPVSGLYDLIATLRSDAVTPMIIDGVQVDPGQTQLIGQLNFTNTAGKISLNAIPVIPGATGVNGLMISTSAPNSPVVLANIRTWMPESDLDINEPHPVQIISSLKADITQGEQRGCPLTVLLSEARSADPIVSPVCYLEWIDIPAGMSSSSFDEGDYPISGLTGRIRNAGAQTIGYSISVFNPNGQKVILETKEHILDVSPAQGTITFNHSLEGVEVSRLVDTVDLSMIQKSGPQCAITSSISIARQGGTTGELTCLIEFTHLPLGLKNVNATPLLLSGTMTQAGHLPLQWDASLFDTRGNKILIEQGTSYIDVAHPDVETFLEFNVNEASSIEITSTESHEKLWLTKQYSVDDQPLHGQVETTETGFRYTPTTGYVGEDQFTYRVTDESGMAAIGVAEVTVVQFNYPPTSTRVLIQVNEGESSAPTAPVIEDLNSWDTHTLVVTTQPKSGSLEISDGQFIYTPDQGFFGEDTFSYTATDMAGFTVEGKGQVMVFQLNRAPTHMTPDTLTFYQNTGGSQRLTVHDPNIQDTHFLSVVHQPDHGTVTIKGMEIQYRTQGSDDTSVIIRATDSQGLYVDQLIEIHLIKRERTNNIIRTVAPIKKVDSEE